MRDSSWERFRDWLWHSPETGMTLDVSRIPFPDDFISINEGRMNEAFLAMEALEKGDVANPDENRMVGHYWLRAPRLAPTPEIAAKITATIGEINEFAAAIHAGTIAAPSGERFANVLLIGIGGSALGPQLVADALGGDIDKMALFFLDNTDPDGFTRVFRRIEQAGGETLAVVISKSGGTKETRNGMIEARHWLESRGMDFATHAVAVTGSGSDLDNQARSEGWLAIFPMWDWIGGRTSVTSAVGLLPAALQGIDTASFLEGAAAMDRCTRIRDIKNNPASLLALMWLFETRGTGSRDMVILPYKDRLLLLSRYLQQLVMESLGKEKSLNGETVHQGLTVYGNKGSTDQHAYVQQLREGVDNFFVTFIQVLKDAEKRCLEVEPGITSGDYLFGFLLGTREALSEKQRGSATITVDNLTPYSLGALIALFERTVGFYATLVGINAYHQPGVEAGKKAAAAVLAMQSKVVEKLAASNTGKTAAEVAEEIGAIAGTETIFKILEHLEANGAVAGDGGTYVDRVFFLKEM